MNGLEALEELKNAEFFVDDDSCCGCTCYYPLQNEEYEENFNLIENNLKVLQILKEKRVDLGAIYYLVFIEPPIKNSLLERYNQLVYLGKETEKVQLTKEEMQLIVEWLKGE